MSNDYKVDQAKWSQQDIFNQMGNIYSEVGRSFKTMGAKDTTAHDAAVIRAIDLFDATIQTQVELKSPKAREVLRAKEQFISMVTDKNTSKASIEGLDRYFMQFAVAARLNR